MRKMNENGTPYCRRQNEGQVEDKCNYKVVTSGVPLVYINELEC